jgi:N-acetylglucosamine-6-phosphate deacetylase
LVNVFGISIADASFAASTLPASRIGLDNVGSIEIGKRPDFLEFTNNGEIKTL